MRREFVRAVLRPARGRSPAQAVYPRRRQSMTNETFFIIFIPLFAFGFFAAMMFAPSLLTKLAKRRQQQTRLSSLTLPPDFAAIAAGLDRRAMISDRPSACTRLRCACPAYSSQPASTPPTTCIIAQSYAPCKRTRDVTTKALSGRQDNDPLLQLLRQKPERCP